MKSFPFVPVMFGEARFPNIQFVYLPVHLDGKEKTSWEMTGEVLPEKFVSPL
jgi:hypothetical protein